MIQSNQQIIVKLGLFGAIAGSIFGAIPAMAQANVSPDFIIDMPIADPSAVPSLVQPAPPAMERRLPTLPPAIPQPPPDINLVLQRPTEPLLPLGVPMTLPPSVTSEQTLPPPSNPLPRPAATPSIFATPSTPPAPVASPSPAATVNRTPAAATPLPRPTTAPAPVASPPPAATVNRTPAATTPLPRPTTPPATVRIPTTPPPAATVNRTPPAPAPLPRPTTPPATVRIPTTPPPAATVNRTPTAPARTPQTQIDSVIVVAPPPESLQAPTARVQLINGAVTVNLDNQTNAAIVYEVLGDTTRRTLPGRSSTRLQTLRAPVNITFERADGGLIRLTPQAASGAGTLNVTLTETTNFDLDRRALTVQESGNVFLD